VEAEARATTLRALVLRAPAVLALAFGLTLGGCSSNSSSSQSAPEASPSAMPESTYAPSAYHHRHRRHHHGHNGSGAGGVVAAASAAPSGEAWPCNDSQFLSDQQQFASGALQGDQEVDVCGTVTSVLPARDTRSGLHGYYDLQVATGDTIEIVCDLGEMDAPAWPWVKAGEYSYVQGRYYYDSASSQGIDWTHHGTSNSWPNPGYVVVAGTEYQ